LPASYRGAVVLCDLQEMSYEEAAEAMACPVGTVRSRLNRGRALLAERLRAAKWCFA
jgi:RNA polymerase sigma-70 factor (ECF subfamily)